MSSPALTEARTGQKLYEKAKGRIPGGTQLLSKRPEQFLPGNWPAYYRRAKGCTIWDLDDRPLIDFTTSGVGSCLLGYADDDVNAAVVACVNNGSMTTLNAPEEVELADRLCVIHPWAERVRYARTGGEAMAIAVRIARAATQRAKVAFCGYHGWCDWYLSANLGESNALKGHLLPGLDPNGVPEGLRGTALPFHYNQIENLEAIVAEYGPQLAAIVMEPMRDRAPQDGFLEKVRALANKSGAVLIFDEITSGWRSYFGGLHLELGVEPDLAAFAKGMSNGYPMAAIIGRAAVMESAQQTFVSSTFWTERIGPTAALATIAKMERVDTSAHIRSVGEKVLRGWREAAAAAGVAAKVSGIPALCSFAFDLGGASKTAMTFFTQEMLARGYLANGSFYPTYAHDGPVVDRYLAAVRSVFGLVQTAHEQGTLAASLHGPVAHSGFARLT